MPAPDAVRAARLGRLSGIYAIVSSRDPVESARAAIDGGARVVQVRMKDSQAGEILAASREIVALARGRALVVVNDRADLAVLSGADGVHVGDEDLPVAEARAVVGPHLLVGRTVRTMEAARAALAGGADHVGFGPIFPSRTKPLPHAPRGLDALGEVARSLGAPVVAISGIDETNVAAVARAGAACAAVIGAIFDSADPRASAARLSAAFEAGRASRGARGPGGRE